MSSADEGEGCVSSPPPTLAGRIERLFAVHRPPYAPDRPWRNNEVVAACRADGRELSESHLSELRRGIKRNPTMKTLEALAWFFKIRVGYFVDSEVALEVEAELERRSASLDARLKEQRDALEAERSAALELQKAIRDSGVTKAAHRGLPGGARQRAQMMRALAQALLDPTDSEGPTDDSRGPAETETSE